MAGRGDPVSGSLMGALVMTVAVLVVTVTGVVLTRLARPYGTGALTVHKLVAFAATVYLGVLTYRESNSGALDEPEVIVLAGALVACLTAIASGGAVSAMRKPAGWIVWSHRVASWAAVVGSAAGLALLASA